MPRMPSDRDRGRSASRTLRRIGRPSVMAYSCQPSIPMTTSPSAYPGCLEATTVPQAKERIGAPMATGSEEFATAFTQPRIAGSIERNSLRTSNSPGCSCGSGTETMLKWSACGIPTGRDANWTWRLWVGSMIAKAAACGCDARSLVGLGKAEHLFGDKAQYQLWRDRGHGGQHGLAEVELDVVLLSLPAATVREEPGLAGFEPRFGTEQLGAICLGAAR